MAETLIANGMRLMTGEGESELFYVGVPEVVEVLIAHGADVNVKTADGATPLSRINSVDVAKVLIAHGADVNAVNDYGIPMINYAIHEIADVVRACQQGKTDVTNRTKKN